MNWNLYELFYLIGKLAGHIPRNLLNFSHTVESKTWGNHYQERDMEQISDPLDPPSAPVQKESALELPENTRRFIWQGKLGPAFWTIASLISISVNIVLFVLLILIGRELFAIKDLAANQLVGGLYQNFIKMDQAHIRTTIEVSDTIPVVFDLPVQTDTVVVLSQPARIKGANVNLSTGGLTLRAPSNIVLPAGTELPVTLNIVVPVNTNIPVKLTVPVDIPLYQTELHEPFNGLQDVVAPYYDLLISPPNSWQDTSLCDPQANWLCHWLTGARESEK